MLCARTHLVHECKCSFCFGTWSSHPKPLQRLDLLYEPKTPHHQSRPQNRCCLFVACHSTPRGKATQSSGVTQLHTLRFPSLGPTQWLSHLGLTRVLAGLTSTTGRAPTLKLSNCLGDSEKDVVPTPTRCRAHRRCLTSGEGCPAACTPFCCRQA